MSYPVEERLACICIERSTLHLDVHRDGNRERPNIYTGVMVNDTTAMINRQLVAFLLVAIGCVWDGCHCNAAQSPVLEQDCSLVDRHSDVVFVTDNQERAMSDV